MKFTSVILFLITASMVQAHGYSRIKPSEMDRSDSVSPAISNENPRYLRALGVQLGFATDLVGDPVFIVLKTSYYIIPQLEAELNIGFKNSAAGFNYHLNRKYSDCRTTPYAGVTAGIERGTLFLLVPTGVSYIFPFGLSLSADLNQLIYLEYQRHEWMVGISAGWNFRIRRK